MTRKHPHVALFLAASAALAMSAMPPTLAAPEAAASGCQAAPKGLVENSWLGGSGSWSDATKWSQAASSPDWRPGTTPASRQGCGRRRRRLRHRGSTSTCWTFDSGARLTLQPGHARCTCGATSRRCARSSGATPSSRSTGPPSAAAGRLQVIGTLDVHRAADRLAGGAQLRGRCRHRSKGRTGLLEIADQGVLDVHGSSSDVRLSPASTSSTCEGWSRLRESAGLVADNGTTMLLQQHSYGSGARHACSSATTAGSSRAGPRRHQAAGDLRERGPDRQARQPGLTSRIDGTVPRRRRDHREVR